MKMSEFLSTLPVRGATGLTSMDFAGFVISIHAPREGSDSGSLFEQMTRYISIHAPREGSDSQRLEHSQRNTHFYPRSP